MSAFSDGNTFMLAEVKQAFWVYNIEGGHLIELAKLRDFLHDSKFTEIMNITGSVPPL